MRSIALVPSFLAMVWSSPALSQSLPGVTPLPVTSFIDRNGVDIRTGRLGVAMQQINIGDIDVPVFKVVLGRQGESAPTSSIFGGVISELRCTQENAPVCRNWHKVEYGSVSEWFYYLDDKYTNDDGGFESKEGNNYVITVKDGTRLIFDPNRRVAPVHDGTPEIELARLLRIEKPDGEIVEVGGVAGTPYFARSSLGYAAMGSSGADPLTSIKLVNLRYASCSDFDHCNDQGIVWPLLKKDVLDKNIYDVLGNLSNQTYRAMNQYSTEYKVENRDRKSYSYEMKIFYPNTQYGIFGVSSFANVDGITKYNYSIDGSGTWSDTRITGATVNYPDGHSFSYSHPLASSIYSIWYDQDARTELRFNSGRNPYAGVDGSKIVWMKLPEGNVRDFFYDKRGNLTKVIETSKNGLKNRVASYVFPSVCVHPKTCNKPTSVTDFRGNTSEYEYDPVHGGVLSETLPADDRGIRKVKRYFYQQLTGKQRQADGSLVATLPAWRLTSTSECRNANPCSGTADELVTVYGYDDNLLRSSETVRDGTGAQLRSQATSRDPVGNVVAVDGPAPGAVDVTAFRYDALRRQVASISPDPDDQGPLKHLVTVNSYDAEGHVVQQRVGSIADQATPLDSATIDKTTYTIYDDVGRPKSVTVEGGSTRLLTQYDYNTSGRLLCVAQRMNPAVFGSAPASACEQSGAGAEVPDRITRNTYNAAGQILKIEKGLGTPLVQDYVTYQYSANGKRISVLDANGNLATMTYDGFDRQSTWFFPSKSIAGASSTDDYEEYWYDDNDNRTALRRRDGRILSFGYDALNRMTSKIVPDGCAPGETINCPATTATRDVFFGYDLQGHQTYARFDGPNGEGISNEFDALGRLTGSTTSLAGTSRTVGAKYDAVGNRTQLTTPAMTWTYGYNRLNRLTGLYEGIGTANSLSIWAYNPQGLPQSVSERFGSGVSWHYDGIGRLDSQSDMFVGGTGNVTTGFEYNSASQIRRRARDNENYTFNGHVNLSRNYVANGLNQYTTGGSAGFKYDRNGNLIESRVDTGPNAGTLTYTYDAENRLVGMSDKVSLVYDPLGRLFEVSTGGGKTQFLYDGDQLTAEYDGAGNLTNSYVHGPGDDDPLVWYPTGDQPRWYHRDHLGSIIALATGPSGTLGQTNAYDDFGIPRSGNVGRFQYTGQAWIPELGLYHYKARVYSPYLGRFFQTDPIGYDDQINLYAYVANDPINGRDPTGEQIYRDTHRVGGVGPQHSKIVIVPQDQGSWSRSTVFKSGGTLPDGRVYITIGGGPDRGNAVDRGNLIITPNRPTDLNLSNDLARKELSLPKGVTENAMIGNLLQAQSNYKDNLDYDLFPNAAFNDSNSYNSNGAVTGLLDAVGLDSSQNRSLVGGDKPVPKGCFSKDQGGCPQ